MSPSPISRSEDIQRLQHEGYALEIRSGHLLVHDVPYVTSKPAVARGVLVTTLNLAGDVTAKPDTHVAYFVGKTPCDRAGHPLEGVINASATIQLAADITVEHTFSAKPTAGYANYYEKVMTYVTLLSSPAAAIDPAATARTFREVSAPLDDSPFHYVDTSSTRARIAAISDKFKAHRLAIAGLGGSGAYLLDQAAKTPVAEVHLFDGDRFCQHNAFRAPGAASIQDFADAPFKVDYFTSIYSRMHKGIVAHAYFLDEANVSELELMDFVFLAIDNSAAKAPIIEALEKADIPFIDVGMGLHEVDGSIGGVLRVTTSIAGKREHLRSHVSLATTDGDDEYDQNIQVADLNAMNAILASIRWKKHLGFYSDLDHEHQTTYTIDGNLLINDEKEP